MQSRPSECDGDEDLFYAGSLKIDSSAVSAILFYSRFVNGMMKLADQFYKSTCTTGPCESRCIYRPICNQTRSRKKQKNDQLCESRGRQQVPQQNAQINLGIKLHDGHVSIFPLLFILNLIGEFIDVGQYNVAKLLD